MKWNKKMIMVLYTLIVACIGFATIIEKYEGTTFVGEHIYGAWWFVALWAVLTVAALAYMVEQRVYKRSAVMLLHLSFVVILAGALTTHLFARRGTVRLRTGVPEIIYVDKDHKVEHLPFSLTLKEFRIINYPGTDAPLDYQSVILHGEKEVLVSMNNIGYIEGYRLFQQSYDSDGDGVLLGISYDPYGIAITYLGYLMLLLGIIATLLSRKTQMRALYRKAITGALLLMSISAHAEDGLQLTVDKDIAHRMGTINVLYNNRICPLNTVAIDFVTKLSGNASWQGYSADEVFMSWMIYYSPWEKQKLIRVKSREIQQMLGIDSQWASYSDFLDAYHEYKLKDAIMGLKTGQSTIDRKALMDADEKFHLVEMFYHGQFIRMFPYSIKGVVNWYSPGGQALPREIPVKEQFFIKQSMDFLTESIVTGQRDRAFEIIAKIKLFQRDMIGDILPSERATATEIFYNTLRSYKWPVFLALTLSLILCVISVLKVKNEESRIKSSCVPMVASQQSWSDDYIQDAKTPQQSNHNSSLLTLNSSLILFNSSLFIYISLQLGLRWWLSGHIPVSNGHETMLFMAWVLILLTFLLYRKFPIMMSFGPLIASFCLLVSMLAGSNSQLTPLMPVLQSPLLSVHVMTVMCAYAIFALQVLLGIQALLLMKKHQHTTQLDQITALSQLMLYPAVFLLTIGIFLGAVWANVSWGNYWSWDPKESWALITLMVYAVPLHKASLGIFRRPRFYHIYIVAAFLAVLITYFGVNYLLGGMHSYA